MKISLVTTCANKVGESIRLDHLKQTLIQNMRDNPNKLGLDVEFVVLNYGDKGGLHEWMMNDPSVQSEIESGRLVYAHTTEPLEFRHAHAKNMAHRLATGDVLCNVDADNFTGPGFAAALKDVFYNDMNSVVVPYEKAAREQTGYAQGVYGRISMSRKNFLALGGYNESYKGWGGEDSDLLRRARMADLEYHQFADVKHMKVIGHGDDARVVGADLSPDEKEKAMERIKNCYNGNDRLPKLAKQFMAVVNRLPVVAKIMLVANKGTNFGLGTVSLYKGDETPAEISVKPVEQKPTQLFNSLNGVIALVRGRLSPSIIRLSNPGAGPS